MSTDTDIAEADPAGDDTPTPLRLQMDPDAVDAAGRAMMTSAALLRAAFAEAVARLNGLLAGPPPRLSSSFDL